MCTTSDPCHDPIGARQLEPVAYLRGWTSTYRYNAVALGPIPVLGLESTYDESARLHRIGSLTTTCGATCATKTRPGPDEMQPQLALIYDERGNALASNGVSWDLALPSIQIGATSGPSADNSEPQTLEGAVLVRTSDGVAYDAPGRMGRRATTTTRALSATFATPRSERESHAQVFVFFSARGDSYSERLNFPERPREGRAWSLAIAGDQLGYAADDAIRMHEELARLGYSSTLLTGSNARSATILRWVSDRSLSSEPEDQLVVAAPCPPALRAWRDGARVLVVPPNAEAPGRASRALGDHRRCGVEVPGRRGRAAEVRVRMRGNGRDSARPGARRRRSPLLAALRDQGHVRQVRRAPASSARRA